MFSGTDCRPCSLLLGEMQYDEKHNNTADITLTLAE
jgi:hypothetical protein